MATVEKEVSPQDDFETRKNITREFLVQLQAVRLNSFKEIEEGPIAEYSKYKLSEIIDRVESVIGYVNNTTYKEPTPVE